jgi:bifunctional UDP-N-acetylglucosamine pyrophosphorylase/glucosamine-1-phosphate N-acetyltransferase
MKAAILLAAGHGTRMRSTLPKALHPLAGRPMLAHLIAACEQVFDRILVVVGPDMAAVEKVAAPHPVAVQAERLGTAHAALCAAPLLVGFGGDVAVLYADNPLIRPATLSRLLAARAGADLVLLAMRPADPGRYGRVVTDASGRVQRIVEWADATEAERAIGLCNAGAVCAAWPDLERWLRAVGNANARGEYYLTDVVALAAAEGRVVRAVEAPEAELLGINSRAELAAAEAAVQHALRQAAMARGTTLIAPDTVFFAFDTETGEDTVIHPHVVFGPGVVLQPGAEVRSFSHLEGCVVERGAVVGPFARLRPGTRVEAGAQVGNFVELKATRLGRGAKANHLTYLGDAEVGAEANIGAGTITCNYDGVAKHRTVIGEGAFIGSDTALVAPVRVGAGAITAAGSVITEEVPADALALGRARQVVKPGRGMASRRGGR